MGFKHLVHIPEMFTHSGSFHSAGYLKQQKARARRGLAPYVPLRSVIYEAAVDRLGLHYYVGVFKLRSNIVSDIGNYPQSTRSHAGVLYLLHRRLFTRMFMTSACQTWPHSLLFVCCEDYEPPERKQPTKQQSENVILSCSLINIVSLEGHLHEDLR